MYPRPECLLRRYCGTKSLTRLFRCYMAFCNGILHFFKFHRLNYYFSHSVRLLFWRSRQILFLIFYISKNSAVQIGWHSNYSPKNRSVNTTCCFHELIALDLMYWNGWIVCAADDMAETLQTSWNAPNLRMRRTAQHQISDTAIANWQNPFPEREIDSLREPQEPKRLRLPDHSHSLQLREYSEKASSSLIFKLEANIWI